MTVAVRYMRHISHYSYLHSSGLREYFKIKWEQPYEYLVGVICHPWIQGIIVLFILYFCLLVFGILVTLVAWFSFFFFPSCPSCLAKCKQMFSYFHNFVGKSDQKPKAKNGTNKTKLLWVHISTNTYIKSFEHPTLQ